MGRSVARKLIESHLVEGRADAGEEVALRVDQTLTQDATGTLVMLELEAMGLDRVRTELSAQYVDHNLVQQDSRNPDDHAFLRSACRRFGIWFSPPGNGVSHPVHQARFGRPGKTLLGSDSHTPSAGAIGMLAIGAGGLDVALAMAGEPFHLRVPRVRRVRLEGRLPDWVSAKDVILEMLRRHGVRGGIGWIVEYSGPGLEQLSVMDRHVIANMGTELGATTTVFPADGEVSRFLAAQGRGSDFVEILADPDADYDAEETLDLSSLEPLVALPSSPGAVVPVREVAGREVAQCYVGSSANPGYRDIAVVAETLAGRTVRPGVSLDINPASRQVLQDLIRHGQLLTLVSAGARVHQPGCNGCIGMGQAPATGTISVRTVPRNFPGRSGARDDQVYLASPETAAASALTGVLTDPRTLEIPCPRVGEPRDQVPAASVIEPPLRPEQARRVQVVRGPSVASMPPVDRLPDRMELPILLKVGDDVSTDEIMPAGARVLPLRSNVPEISRYVFEPIDPGYSARALGLRERGGHAVLAGRNYGQGSSREHAAIAPRYLGLRLVLALGFARIHWNNLVNFGVLPLVLEDEAVYRELEQGDVLQLASAGAGLGAGVFELRAGGREFRARLEVSPRLAGVLRAGGLVNWIRDRLEGASAPAR